MRYFWHLIISVILLSVIVFLFFVFSVRVHDHVTYTDTKKITEPEVTIADPSLGPADAPVTIVNYGDYECSACAKLDSTLQEIRNTYGDSVRIVWKDMPNSSQHQEALHAAVAARCADKQKKFWDYHNLLMLNQSLLGQDLYTAIAQELKLKENAFSRCVENQETLPLVERTYDEGVALQIPATPTLFLNGERFTGDTNTSELKRAIDSLIASM